MTTLPTEQELAVGPVAFSTPLGALSGPTAITFGADENVAVLFADGQGSVRCRLYKQRIPDPVTRSFPADRELGDAAIELTGTKPLRAFSLPPGTVKLDYSVNRALGIVFVGLTGLALAITAPILLGGSQLGFILATAAIAAALIAVALMSKRGGVGSDKRFVPSGSRTGIPFTSLLSSRPSKAAAEKLVAQVKDEYGALLSDIVVRIEQPALFDPAVPTTRAFTNAIIQWDSNHGAMTPSDVSQAAAQVRLTFDAARSHAQTVGLSHVPEDKRADVERASKAARLAKSARGAESRTALQRAVEILSSLHLYYMPTAADAEAIVGGKARLALPGRRTEELDDE